MVTIINSSDLFSCLQITNQELNFTILSIPYQRTMSPSIRPTAKIYSLIAKAVISLGTWN